MTASRSEIGSFRQSSEYKITNKFIPLLKNKILKSLRDQASSLYFISLLALKLLHTSIKNDIYIIINRNCTMMKQFLILCAPKWS